MKKTALIIVDLQNEYLVTGKLPLTGIEEAAVNAARVLDWARQKKMPIFHIRHEFTDSNAPFFVPDSDGVKIQKNVAPKEGEPVITKHHINAFRETNLQQQLAANEVEALVIVGAMSHMCVDAVVRAAVDMGYSTTVLHDACATLDLSFNGVSVPAAHVHATMMAAFEFGYAQVMSTEQYLN